MIYEVCTYTVPNPMRIKDMLNVIEACVPFYAKHEMRLVGVWTTGKQLGAGMNQVIYMLEFDDYKQLESQWHALRSDPEWKAEEQRVANGDFSFIQDAQHVVMAAPAFSPPVMGRL